MTHSLSHPDRRAWLVTTTATLIAAGGAGCSATPAALASAPAGSAAPRTLDLPFGRLAWQRVGTRGPVLLAWPSLYCDHRMYTALAQALPEAQWLLVDAPGSGASRLTARRLTMADCVAAAHAVLDAEGAQRATVVGTSWGGIVGCELALAAPHRVAGVAAFNTPFDREDPVPLSTRAILWLGSWMGDTAFFGRQVAASFFPPGFDAAQPERLALFLDMFTQGDRAGMTTAARLVLAERAALSPRLAGVSAPALVVAGTADTLYPPQQVDAQSRSLPRRRLEQLAGCGHLAPLEQPEACAALLRGWLPTLA